MTTVETMTADHPRSDELSAVLRDYVSATQRLQSTHDTLQHEVVRLREELAGKDEELQRRRRLAELGELAAGVAHEVRNPLGAIQLYSGLLRTSCQHAPGALELIDKIQNGIRAIDGVVQDTLALVPRGVKAGACRVSEVLRRAHDGCRPVLERHGVRLSLALGSAQVAALADEAALERVLINLITNAAEASGPGTEIRVRVSRTPRDSVRISVQDQGVGLKPEVLHRIFDPFFTTKKTGTGLGLAIAHRLVTAQGGALRARNRARGGAEFIVTIPANPAKSTETPDPSRRVSAA